MIFTLEKKTASSDRKANTPFTRSSKPPADIEQSKRQANIEQLYVLTRRASSSSQLHRVNGVLRITSAVGSMVDAGSSVVR